MLRYCLLTTVWLLCSVKGIESIQFNVFNSGNIYRFSYPEATSFTNDTELGRVACTEAGGGALNGSAEYYITGSNQLPFKLNSVTGTLTLLDGESLDYEMVQSYVFNVSCSYISDASTSAIAAVEFSVQPVNEFLPVVRDSSVAVTIREDIPVGTVIASTSTSGIARYTVTDNDAGLDGELSFFPGSDNPPGFEINQITGDLTLTQSLDVDNTDEGAARISLTIAVCDGNRPRAECVNQQISAIVVPFNDNPPVFGQDQYEITLLESTPVGTAIITVSCTDADRTTGEFQGISVEPINGHVSIPDKKNGTIILSQPLDFESEQSITLSLVCRDSGFPVREDNATLVIFVTAVNDNAPHFNQTSYAFNVDRISLTGQTIGRVEALEMDLNVGNSLTYSLKGESSEKFLIRSDGTIVLNKFIFAFEGSIFELMVVTSDGAHNDTASVFVTVDGVLSVPEITLIALSGLILCLVVFVCVCCCCCLSRKHNKSLKGKCEPRPAAGDAIELQAIDNRGETQTTPVTVVNKLVTQEQQNWLNTSLPATRNNPYVDNLVKSEHSGFGNCDNMYLENGSSEITLDQTDSNFCSSAVTFPESRKFSVVSDSLQQSNGPDGDDHDDDDESLYDDIGELVPADRKLGMSTLSLPVLSSCNLNPLEQGGEKIAVCRDLDWGTVSDIKKSKSVAEWMFTALRN